MTNKYDMRWKQGDYHYYENLIPKLKDDAPQWVVDSYNHYRQQLREEFSDRNGMMKKRSMLISYNVTQDALQCNSHKAWYNKGRRSLWNLSLNLLAFD